MPTFLRAMVSADGTIGAEVYQVRFRLLFRLRTLVIGQTTAGVRSIEFETEFSDGTFVATLDNAMARTFRDYPSLERIICAPETPPAMMLRLHRERVQDRLAAKPGLSVIRIQSLEDFYAHSDRLDRAKAAHRNATGYVTAEEIQRVATNGGQNMSPLAADAAAKLSMAMQAINSEPNAMGKRLGKIAIHFGAICLVSAILVPIGVAFFNSNPYPNASRSKSDMRAIATAVESYYADHGAFPRMLPLRTSGKYDGKLKRTGGWDLMTVDPGDAKHAGLTTPIAYMSALPKDIRSPRGAYPYAYYTDDKGWILFSAGPDGDYDLNPAKDYNSSETQPSAHLKTHGTYDPTNGSQSNGDIWRVKE